MPTIITRGAASARGFGFGGAKAIVTGQQAYTTAGTYSWVAPAGVTKVSVVAVGPGGGGCFGCLLGGHGGGLGYKNNITVIPGNSYAVSVGAWGISCSYFCNSTVVAGLRGISYAGGGTYVGDGGGNGGAGCRAGGGAGGYAGNGGKGGRCTCNGTAGTGGGGGGGGGYTNFACGYGGAGGGGVGLLGQGSSGCGGIGSSGTATGGGGGSGGAAGTSGNRFGAPGGLYGGGRGGGSCVAGASGANGAVRIIWPGTTRQFPSTGTGNL